MSDTSPRPSESGTPPQRPEPVEGHRGSGVSGLREAQAAVVGSGDTERRFREISEAEWRWRTESLGGQWYGSSDEVDPTLPDVSEHAWQARGERWRSVLAELEPLEPGELSPAARVDWGVYRDQVQTLLAQVEHRLYQRPANADSAFWTGHLGRARRRHQSLDAAERFLAQLQELPRWFDQHVENMRAGLRRGFAPPRVTMVGREQPVRTVAEATRAEDTPYLAAFTELPASLDPAAREELLIRARQVIETVVVPAFGRLLAFLETEYLPQLPESTAAVDGPGGREFYTAQLREFTTTDLSAEEIFEIGQREVASITAEMEVVAAEVGFAGDVPGLLAMMRTDARFYARTERELVMHAAYETKKFDAVVHRWFGRVPRHRFGIIEPPPDLAPFYTFGRGGLDAYTINTYNLPARPLYSLPALTLHEAAPGHCFQAGLAHESEELPPYRRHVYISAYGEGWALYAERLGVEMGIYEDPYEIMGMLSFQMWRAVRLVVDPGMHAMGWSREQGQDFLRRHTAIAEHEVVTEIDRYLAWPGQACAYHLGQLKILQLRRRVAEALGERFDVRRFHDLVLGLGSVPLDVLEAEVERDLAANLEEIDV